MTVQRLTLLPQPMRSAPAAERTEDENALPEITSISRFSQGGRWRTEAMRSYDRPLLIWFTRGQGRMSVAGQSTGYSPHNALFLPAGTMHGFSVSNLVLGQILWLPKSVAGDWPSEPMHLRLREASRQRELTGLIGRIEEELASDADLSEEAARLHTDLLAIWFARAVAEDVSRAERPETRAAHLTEAFTALVEQDFRRPVGVSYFANTLGVTPTHLSRVCRAVSGRPALDILVDRRHFEACRLLRDTSLPVAEIAKQTGFRSAAYFTRAFRSRASMTPSAFRASR